MMHLGLFILGTGSHVAGWRHPGAWDSFQDIDAVQSIAAAAERACFDMIFMGDNLYADPAAHPSYTVRLEPLTMLAAVAATTSRIGLGATMSTTYSDPFTVARVFASLDHISHGRAAWNAVTGANPAAASIPTTPLATPSPRSSSPSSAACGTAGTTPPSSPTAQPANTSTPRSCAP
jgi:alkanesulfonate monooxygenase SsuD/methylene tetrahydromethanopterin reductase-like flavin-dependent oxidoreductase (luciferase family)